MKASEYRELRKITKDILRQLHDQLDEVEAKIDRLPSLSTYVVAFGLTGCLTGALIGLIIVL